MMSRLVGVLFLVVVVSQLALGHVVWTSPAARTTNSAIMGPSPCGAPAAPSKPLSTNTFFTNQKYIFTYNVVQTHGAASSFNQSLTGFAAVGSTNVTSRYFFPKNTTMSKAVGKHPLEVVFPESAVCNPCSYSLQYFVTSKQIYYTCIDLGVFSKKNDITVSMTVAKPADGAVISPTTFKNRLFQQFAKSGFSAVSVELTDAQFELQGDSYVIRFVMHDNVDATAANMAETLKAADLKATLQLDVSSVVTSNDGTDGGPNVGGSPGATVAVGVVVTLLVLAVLIGGYFFYRKKIATGECDLSSIKSRMPCCQRKSGGSATNRRGSYEPQRPPPPVPQAAASSPPSRAPPPRAPAPRV